MRRMISTLVSMLAPTAASTLALMLAAATAYADGHAGSTCNAHDGCFELQIHGYYIINFIVFVGILVYFGRKPLVESLEKRYQEVAKEMEAAKEAKTQAEQRLASYQAKMARLEDENQRMLAEMRVGTQAEMDQILADARHQVARFTADEALRLEQESKRLRDQLQREAAHKALQLAEAMLRERMTAANQATLIDQTLTELEGLAAAGPGNRAS